MCRSRVTIFFTIFTISLFSNIKHVTASPKTLSNHKVNLGWPNFFNPQMAILNKNKDKSANKLKASSTSSDEETHGDDHWDDDLVDYTITGGLRGKVYQTNTTSCSEYIPKEVYETIHGILENEELKSQNTSTGDHRSVGDEDCLTGEVTENALRLRTPMAFRQYDKLLGKYGALISVPASVDNVTFIYYGNWCGRGGRSAPIDGIDRCCLDWDRCYGRLVRECPDVWKRPYNTMYSWSMLQDTPVCVRSEARCLNGVCECDRQVAECFVGTLRLRESLSTPSSLSTNSTIEVENSPSIELDDEILTTQEAYVETNQDEEAIDN